MGDKKPELTVIMVMNVLYIGKFVESPKVDHLLDAGQIMVRTAPLPNGQVMREAIMVGIGGYNRGPIKRYVVQGYTTAYKVTPENVGVAAYEMIHREYASFLEYRKVDNDLNHNPMDDYDGPPMDGNNVVGVTPEQMAQLQQAGLIPPK